MSTNEDVGRTLSAETCERCGEPAECVATVGRDWSERQCEVCTMLSADKGHYVRYDAGGEENA